MARRKKKPAVGGGRRSTICGSGTRVTQLQYGRRDSGPAKDHPPTPTSLYQWREYLGCQTWNAHRTLWLASVGGVVRGSKSCAAMQALTALYPHEAELRIHTPVHRM